MKTVMKRLCSLCLVLCLTLGLTPAALAVGESTTLEQAAQAAGFTYTYAETYTTMTSSSVGGKAEVTVAAPSGLQADRDVYAAILPQNGSASDVRFCRVSGNGPYTVSYAETGKTTFHVMLVQALLDGGPISIRTAAEYQRGGGGKYSLKYTATLLISDRLAMIAAVNKNDVAMNDLVFTCYLDDPVINSLSTIDRSKVQLSSDVFDSSTLQMSKENGIWKATYQLKSGWNSGTTEQVKNRLQQQMSIVVTDDDIQYSTIKNGLVGSKLYTTGWLTITNNGGSNIPGLGQKQITLPANLAELTIQAGALTITVIDGDSQPAEGATVTITMVTNGQEYTYTGTTDANGKITFEPLLQGTYRVDVSYTKDGNQYEATGTQMVVGGNTADIRIALKKSQSGGVLNTKVTGSQSASADGLNEVADAHVSDATSGKTVLITLTVDECGTSQGDAEAQSQSKELIQTYGVEKDQAAAGKTVFVDFVDADLTKTVYNGSTQESKTQLTEPDNVVAIHMPLSDEIETMAAQYKVDLQNIQVYRAHGTGSSMTVERLAKNNSGRDGTYYIETITDGDVTNHYAVIYTQKFSVYGFALPIPSSGGSSNGGNGGSAAYPVTVPAQSNGTTKSSHTSATAGTKVTITPTPDNGYRVGSVTVVTASGSKVAVVANTDGTYSFNMPADAVTVTVTYTVAIADPVNTGVSNLLNTDDHVEFMHGYTNGNFGPGRNITRGEVAQVFYNLLRDKNVATTVTFKDVPENAWYAKAINTLASLGIVAGIGNGNYEPDRAVTRAEFSAIMVRFAKQNTSSTLNFTDVPASYWAYDYIQTAASYGWVNGFGDNTFGPRQNITRAQAATMVNRMLGRLCDKNAIDNGMGRQFPDVSKTYWAWYEIGEATTAHDYHMNSDRTMETWGR